MPHTTPKKLYKNDKQVEDFCLAIEKMESKNPPSEASELALEFLDRDNPASAEYKELNFN